MTYMKFTILVHPSFVIITIHLFCLIYAWVVKEIMQFHFMTYLTTPQHKNPYPMGHDIYNFGRPLFGHLYYILGLSDLCLGVEKTILKEIMQFHYCLPIRDSAQSYASLHFLFSVYREKLESTIDNIMMLPVIGQYIVRRSIR